MNEEGVSLPRTKAIARAIAKLAQACAATDKVEYASRVVDGEFPLHGKPSDLFRSAVGFLRTVGHISAEDKRRAYQDKDGSKPTFDAECSIRQAGKDFDWPARGVPVARALARVIEALVGSCQKPLDEDAFADENVSKAVELLKEAGHIEADDVFPWVAQLTETGKEFWGEAAPTDGKG